MAAKQIDRANLPEKACKFCVWCHGQGDARQCRYNPPRATGFPIVKPHHWCSKYEPNDILIDAEISRKNAQAAKDLEIEKALNPK